MLGSRENVRLMNWAKKLSGHELSQMLDENNGENLRRICSIFEECHFSKSFIPSYGGLLKNVLINKVCCTTENDVAARSRLCNIARQHFTPTEGAND